jgi:RNA polymerase sigma-70 factor (ECF subfamily)
MSRQAPDRFVLEYYDREQLPLRRYLIFSGVTEATAEEIVQETFLRLHRHLLANGDASNLRAWLYRVAHNLARNEQLSMRNKSRTSIHDENVADTMAARGGTPESQLLLRERELRVHRAMQSLSAPQRDCLLLRAQGMKYREIAAVLNLSISSVAENVQRALEHVKELL